MGANLRLRTLPNQSVGDPPSLSVPNHRLIISRKTALILFFQRPRLRAEVGVRRLRRRQEARQAVHEQEGEQVPEGPEDQASHGEEKFLYFSPPPKPCIFWHYVLTCLSEKKLRIISMFSFISPAGGPREVQRCSPGGKWALKNKTAQSSGRQLKRQDVKENIEISFFAQVCVNVPDKRCKKVQRQRCNQVRRPKKKELFLNFTRFK